MDLYIIIIMGFKIQGLIRVLEESTNRGSEKYNGMGKEIGNSFR